MIVDIMKLYREGNNDEIFNYPERRKRSFRDSNG